MTATAHVVGSGPVAMIAALNLARTQRVALYLRERKERTQPCPTNVEVVPAGLMALLIEFGVHPSKVGVRNTECRRHVAWDTVAPHVLDHAAQTVHVERPHLDDALLRLAEQHHSIRVVPATDSDLQALKSIAPDAIYDATGRRAALADKRFRVNDGPAARVWTQALQLPQDERAFRIAATPDGFVYRAASANTVALGFCGNSTLTRLRPTSWGDYLRDVDASWLLLQSASQAHWQTGKAGEASVQYCASSSGIRLLGDAACARDVLASQGLSIGISDALYGCSALGADERNLWQQHRQGQFVKHLERLAIEISRCRFSKSSYWLNYANSICSALSKFPLIQQARRARLVWRTVVSA